MKCQFHPEALSVSEYEEAARYYAGCQAGLELRFMASVEAAVRQIADSPERWRIVEQDVDPLHDRDGLGAYHCGDALPP